MTTVSKRAKLDLRAFSDTLHHDFKTPVADILRDPKFSKHGVVWTDASHRGLGGYNESNGEYFFFDTTKRLDFIPPRGHISEGEFLAALLALEIPREAGYGALRARCGTSGRTMKRFTTFCAPSAIPAHVWRGSAECWSSSRPISGRTYLAST